MIYEPCNKCIMNGSCTQICDKEQKYINKRTTMLNILKTITTLIAIISVLTFVVYFILNSIQEDPPQVDEIWVDSGDGKNPFVDLGGQYKILEIKGDYIKYVSIRNEDYTNHWISASISNFKSWYDKWEWDKEEGEDTL